MKRHNLYVEVRQSGCMMQSVKNRQLKGNYLHGSIIYKATIILYRIFKCLDIRHCLNLDYNVELPY